MHSLTHKIFTTILSLLAVAMSSCSSIDVPADEPSSKAIIFIFSPGGLGDMSYNDRILEGIQRFKKQNDDVDIYIYSPKDIDEAERIFSDWLARPQSDVPALFVLGSSDYEPMAGKYLAEQTLTENKSILLFESRWQYADAKIHSFQISMYGASYLAGAVAKKCSGDKKSLIVLANDSDGPIGIAKDGFMAGNGGNCDVEYLADDWTGFVSASLAYRKMDAWAANYGFIFPVAGGSNAGIYRYSREFDDSPFLAGMDVDQSNLSDKITGSVIKHIDKLVYEYLTEWTQTGTMPERRLYGLESGYADWQLSPLYLYEFEDMVNSLRPEAIAMEKEYYEADGI